MEYDKLGKELGIYTSIDYIGKGCPIILPNGAKMIKLLKQMVESEEEKEGYRFIRTPSISTSEIYKIENRCEDGIYKIQGEKEEDTIVFRPYVRPFHCSIFKENIHTYK